MRCRLIPSNVERSIKFHIGSHFPHSVGRGAGKPKEPFLTDPKRLHRKLLIGDVLDLREGDRHFGGRCRDGGNRH